MSTCQKVKQQEEKMSKHENINKRNDLQKMCVDFSSFALHGFRGNICLLYGNLAQENYKISLNLQLIKCKKITKTSLYLLAISPTCM